jgi:asparagine synthase (glutamine-hydrolysing)
MSGICGIIRFDGGPVEARDLDRQITRLEHLGPDRTRTSCAGPVGLGHLMMRITHEDAFDVQPLHDADLTLVADLRLDNREELAAALSIDAAALSDMPDSALLFAAYKKWGADCVGRLIGDFAFAVWDNDKKTLTLARDHMGQRHVFYHQGEGFFAFASEIKGLWALPQAPRVLLEDRVAQALLFDEPTEVGATDYEGIRAVPGGTVMTIAADGETASRRYWEPHADPVHEGRDEAYYIETYRKGVDRSRRLPATPRHRLGRSIHGRRLRFQRHLRPRWSGGGSAGAQVHRRVFCDAGGLSRQHPSCA